MLIKIGKKEFFLMAAFGEKDEDEKAVEILSSEEEYDSYQEAIDNVSKYLESSGLESVNYNLDFIVSEAFETDGLTYVVSVDSEEFADIVNAGELMPGLELIPELDLADDR